MVKKTTMTVQGTPRANSVSFCLCALLHSFTMTQALGLMIATVRESN